MTGPGLTGHKHTYGRWYGEEWGCTCNAEEGLRPSDKGQGQGMLRVCAEVPVTSQAAVPGSHPNVCTSRSWQAVAKPAPRETKQVKCKCHDAPRRLSATEPQLGFGPVMHRHLKGLHAQPWSRHHARALRSHSPTPNTLRLLRLYQNRHLQPRRVGTDE